MSKPIAPWTPVQVQESENNVKVSVWGREYTIDNDALFTSIKSGGEELLSAPIRLVGEETDGKPMVWEDKQAFVCSNNESEAIICTTQHSECFTINTALTVEYDGSCRMDVKLMTHDLILQQKKTWAKEDKLKFWKNPCDLKYLWLEIPLKKSLMENYHCYPSTVEFECGDITIPQLKMSRKIPSSMKIASPRLVWLGNTEKGLCFYSDNQKSIELADKKCGAEVIVGEDDIVLRVRLLDKHPSNWTERSKWDTERSDFPTISFKLGLQATPTKPFPENPYKEKVLQIDCFEKTPGEYSDYLSKPTMPGSDEIGYDRMKRLGVTTLVLHEKWNKFQNSWLVPNDTARRTEEIVRECHKRGIKVIPYYGYEVSTLSPLWTGGIEKYVRGQHWATAWYRVPHQRARRACFNCEFADMFLEGIKGVVERFDFDGIYLDGTLMPHDCDNKEHGCGYYDYDGNYVAESSVFAVREMMKKLYEFFAKRGGIVNSHISNICNVPALTFVDINWDGEAASEGVVGKEGINALPLDYMRTEYIGRNFGTVYEFLAYNMSEKWGFKDAPCVSLIHGILLRPNSINEPLEVMSPVWKALDEYDVTGATWKPYWSNGVDSNSETTYISYYEKKINGKAESLVFVGNPSEQEAENVNLAIYENVDIKDAITGEQLGASIDIAPCGWKVLRVTEK